MINNQLLEILRCPQDHSALTQATHDLVKRVNQGITDQRIVNFAGQPLQKRLDGGLLRAAGDVMYPVVAGIPVLLPDEAIEISQLDNGG